MADYSNAIDYFVDASRVFVDQNSHSAITIHGTGGNPSQTAQQLGDWFRSDPAMASSHYGIDRAGTICQYALEKDGACANCCVQPGYDPFWEQFNGDNLNIHTISIEHENDAANSLPLTDAQKTASFQLVAYLCNKYGIPASNIKSHASIAPIDRAQCPGNYPWSELLDYLNGNTTPQEEQLVISLSDPNVNQYFYGGDDSRWNCKNGNSIAYGILNFWRAYGNSGLCGLTHLGLPLTNELYPQPGVAVQLFERGIVASDPQHKLDGPPGAGDCYLMHIDSGYGHDQLVKPLQDRLTQLQAQAKQQQAAQTPSGISHTTIQNALTTIGAAIVAIQNTSTATSAALAAMQTAEKDLSV